MIPLSAARARATSEAAAAIAQELNGPLTALMLYMGELKRHGHQMSQASDNPVYLQQVIENALRQSERVYAVIRQFSDGPVARTDPSDRANAVARGPPGGGEAGA